MSRQKGARNMGLQKIGQPTTGGRCRKSKYEPHQGKRECARRIRQGLARA